MIPAHVDVQSEAMTLEKLKALPGALFGAVDANGLLVEMPDSAGVAASQVIKARSVLDVVSPSDWVAVIESWEVAHADGSSYVTAQLALPSLQRVGIFLYDCVAHDGVYLAIFVAQVNSAEVGLHLADSPPPAPRIALTKKDATAVYKEVDEAAVRMFGWSRAELIGKRALYFVHPDDQENATDCWLQMLAHPGQTFRVRLRHSCSDGTWKWVELTNSSLLEPAAGGYVLSEMLDVSDEMAALEALRGREQMLHRLAEALPTGVLQIDLGRNVVYANSRLGEVLGVSEGATTDERFGSLDDVDRHRFEIALSRTLLRGTDCDLEVGIGSTLGLQRRCQVAIRALTAVDGSVTGAVLCATDVTDSARMRADLERRATTDLPTGCRNRTWVMARLAELVQTDDDLAVIFADIDEFKSVNDQFGHAAGDDMLTTLAGRLMGASRTTDTVGRVGGDEFLVVCPEVGGQTGALKLLQRLADAAGRPGRLRDDVQLSGVSLGMAYEGGRHLSADELVAEADARMYKAKRAHQRDRRRKPEAVHTSATTV